jgi:hypothetical protein
MHRHYSWYAYSPACRGSRESATDCARRSAWRSSRSFIRRGVADVNVEQVTTADPASYSAGRMPRNGVGAGTIIRRDRAREERVDAVKVKKPKRPKPVMLLVDADGTPLGLAVAKSRRYRAVDYVPKPEKATSEDIIALSRDLLELFGSRFMKLEDWVRAVKTIGGYVGARSES